MYWIIIDLFKEILMPVVVSYIDDGCGVEICLSDVVHGKEIIQAKKDIVENKSFVGVAYQLIDKTLCTEYNVTADEIVMVSEYDKIIAIINHDFVTAIVESNTLKYSLTKLWQNIVRDFDFKNNIFSDRETALQWVYEELNS